jgi:conjugal transfer pilin signal peptidase TrbI
VGWWAIGLAKVSVALAVMYAPLAWFEGHYRIVYDAIKGPGCLPYSVYLVDLRDRALGRGEYVAFRSPHIERFYNLSRGGVVLSGEERSGGSADAPRATIVVKVIAGVPGDHVTVNDQGVAINGRSWGGLPHLQVGEKLWRMGVRLADVRRDERIPEGHLWVAGTNPRSFDSRYWGYVRTDEVVGRAIPMW